MRKDKKNLTIETRSLAQGYHNGNFRNESYAFEGFRRNLYYTSDRAIELTPDFKRADDKPMKGYGLEIETETTMLHNESELAILMHDFVTNDFPNELFKYQHDGSLHNGIEAITQVMTKEFVRNHYPHFKSMFQKMRMLEISAAESGNCGMHCNMSNQLFGTTKEIQLENIRKLYYIVNRHFKEMCIMLKRPLRNTWYCNQMDVAITIEKAKSVDLSRWGNDHHKCFNFSHIDAGRIELRLVGGQPDYYAFRNTMETIFHLIDNLKDYKWDKLDSLEYVFQGCNQFVLKRLVELKDANLISTEIYNSICEKSVTVDFGNC